jgi:hypothetical protein
MTATEVVLPVRIVFVSVVPELHIAFPCRGVVRPRLARPEPRAAKAAPLIPALLTGRIVGAANLGRILPKGSDFLHCREAHQLEVLHGT